MHRLNVTLMTVTFALWSAVMFAACVVYGLLFPAFHASWLLENVLPGFRWLTPGAFVLGVVETFLYGGGAGFVFSVLYNWLLPRVASAATERRTIKTAVGVIIGISVIGAWLPHAVEAQSSVAVTVQELIQRDHRLMVPAGTEVLWRDSHFERVWFPAGTDAPRVERAEVGFRAVFAKPGTYRGRFTIVGGRRSDDVYPLIVTVTGR